MEILFSILSSFLKGRMKQNRLKQQADVNKFTEIGRTIVVVRKVPLLFC